ncbi:MAG: hypothetical protein GY731_14340, partial [Gammaproteobacteria bacterium]|nr:hypothetical protein [Gammaproteobacteria bacterium]
MLPSEPTREARLPLQVFAYMDVGKGRELGAVSFAYMDVGKGRELGAVSFAAIVLEIFGEAVSAPDGSST